MTGPGGGRGGARASACSFTSTCSGRGGLQPGHHMSPSPVLCPSPLPLPQSAPTYRCGGEERDRCCPRSAGLDSQQQSRLGHYAGASGGSPLPRARVGDGGDSLAGLPWGPVTRPGRSQVLAKAVVGSPTCHQPGSPPSCCHPQSLPVAAGSWAGSAHGAGAARGERWICSAVSYESAPLAAPRGRSPGWGTQLVTCLSSGWPGRSSSSGVVGTG